MKFFIYAFFCLSGAVALVYESLWSRYLKLFLGHSSYGQIVTLIVFMGGLGLGSFLAARFLSRVRHPFQAYARVELVAAIFGFAFHPAYRAVTDWYFHHAASLQGVGSWLADGVQIGLCLLLTLPFATLLGTTFPLLATGMIRAFPDGGRRSLPTLYFTNSLGGAAGILLASYWLVSQFGTHGALQLASLGNLAVAAGFYFLHKTLGQRAPLPRPAPPVVPDTPVRSPLAPPPAHSRARLWLAIAAGTGLASFIYEVGWIRLLSLILGSSTHSFDTMISAFILGLAFGGLFARRLIDRFTGDLAPVLGVVQVLMGIFAALTIYLYRPFFEAIQASHNVFAKTESAYPLYSAFKYLLSLALMFPAAFCAGMTLPLITWRLVRDTGRESYTGLVYGWNTIGSIVGAALAGLFLMPVLQLKWTIFTGAALDITLGLVLLALVPFPRRDRFPDPRVRYRALAWRSAVALLVAAALLPAFRTRFDPDVIVSGKFRRATKSGNVEYRAIRHGKTATISVGRSPSFLYIATNGKSDGAIQEATPDGKLRMIGDEDTVAQLATLPMLTRDGDYDAAIIGMGTGMTGHYLLGDDRLRSLDLIEIEEAVVELSRHFRPRNERLWHDPRLEIVVEDAKRYFYGHRKQYDLIISEPSNPWVSGVAGLFTKEFYEHVRHFLNPGGVLVQWVHGYEFRDDLLVSILSALDTFEHFEIYRVNDKPGDYMVLASREPIRFIDAETLAAHSTIDEDLAQLDCGIEQLGPRNFIASSQTLRPILDQFADLANSDYFPYVEQHAESAFYTRSNIRLPDFLGASFTSYVELLEPERYRVARSSRLHAEAETTSVPRREDTMAWRHARDLLTGATEETDWPHLEKLLLEATARSAGSPDWLAEPLVEQMRAAVESGIVAEPVRDRFRLLSAIAEGDDEEATVALPEAIASAGELLKEPFWLRTFLVTGVRLQLPAEVGKVVVAGVHGNPVISPDERVLINELADRVIHFDPDAIAGNAAPPGN